MTQTQAFTIATIAAFFILGLVGVVVLLVFPYDQIITPTATSTATSTVTLTPTAVFVLPPTNTPTPAVPVEPSPTNTPVPTFTPRPPSTPTALPAIKLPTPYFRPTATPLPAVVVPTESPTPTATLIGQRQYAISFTADSTTIKRGDCTQLVWRAEGPVTVSLDNQSVSNNSQQKICPERTKDYTLTVQIEGSAEIQRRTIRINVE